MKGKQCTVCGNLVVLDIRKAVMCLKCSNMYHLSCTGGQRCPYCRFNIVLQICELVVVNL